MKSNDDNQSGRFSPDENPVLPDIRGICAKAREESDTTRAFTMLDEMCMVALQGDTHVKDARDIVETFEGLGMRFAKEGRSADAALCYAVTARVATFFSDLEAKVVPSLNRALEYSDFIDIKKDKRLAIEIGYMHQFFARPGKLPDFRNEPERMKFYETGLAFSIICTERAGESMTPQDVEDVINSCMETGQMHAEAGRFKNAGYWLEQGALLAEKISDHDKGFSMWYKAGSCSDESKANNLAEEERCFLHAMKLLPNTQKPDKNTDVKTFNERHEALRVMGFFFFNERLVTVNPHLREKGVECFLQALDDFKEARWEEDFYRSSAVIQGRLGKFYRETNQLELAQTYLREAVTTWKNEIRQAGKDETSQQPSYVREGLAETLDELGVALESLAGKARTDKRERKNLQEAQDSFKEAREVYRDLFAITSPSDMRARATFHRRAQKLARSEGRVAGNRGHWEDAVKILEGAVQFEGKYRKLLRCDVYDEITQDLVHARSHLMKENGLPSRPINNVPTKKHNPRNRKRS